jgi:hypothetical protein
MNQDDTHAETMLNGLRWLSGYVEDVAKHMIALARQRGVAVECEYGGILLRANATTTVEEVRAHFNREGFARVIARSSAWKEYFREKLIIL